MLNYIEGLSQINAKQAGSHSRFLLVEAPGYFGSQGQQRRHGAVLTTEAVLVGRRDERSVERRKIHLFEHFDLRTE